MPSTLSTRPRPEERGEAHGEVEDLAVVELLAQAGEERLVDVRVVERETFCVLDGETLLSGVPIIGVVLGDVS